MRRVLEQQRMASAAEMRRVFTVKRDFRQYKALMAQQMEVLKLALAEAAAARAADAALVAAWKQYKAEQQYKAAAAAEKMEGVEMQGVAVWWDVETDGTSSSSSSMVGVGVTGTQQHQQQQQEEASGATAADDGLWRPLPELGSGRAASSSSFHSAGVPAAGNNCFNAFLQQQQQKQQPPVPKGWGPLARYHGVMPLGVTSSTSTAATTSSSTTSTAGSSSSHTSSSHNSSSTADLTGGVLEGTGEASLAAPGG